MKTTKRGPYSMLRNWPRFILWGVTLYAFALIGSAAAQEVLVPPQTPPPEQLLPPSSETTTNQVPETQSTTTVSQPVGSALSGNNLPFQWGPLTLHPHLAYQCLYGNGLLSAPGQRHHSFINTILPGIGFDLGKHWNLDYTPSFVFYSDPHFRDAFNNVIGLHGHTVYEDWTLDLVQQCALTSNPQVATAQQTDEQRYSTALSGLYQINEALSLDLSVAQRFFFLQGYTGSVGSSLEWNTLDWLNYQWGPNLITGAGASFGYVNVQIGSDMTYEQLQGRLIWRLLDKVSLTVNGGAEVRQFLNSSQPDLVSPVYGASLAYRPLVTTTFSLNARGTVQNSYYQNQIIQNNVVSANLNQRFFGKLYLGLSGGYAETRYSATTSGVASGRTDKYTFFYASLSTRFLKRATASLFYSVSENSSSARGYSYNSDQVGIRLACRY